MAPPPSGRGGRGAGSVGGRGVLSRAAASWNVGMRKRGGLGLGFPPPLPWPEGGPLAPPPLLLPLMRGLARR
jgi:hypothetical protein